MRSLAARLALRRSARGLFLPGVAGNYASTPDSVAASVVGDLDIRLKLAMADWTDGGFPVLLSKRGALAAAGTSYLVYGNPNGRISIAWSDGVTVISKDSTVAPTITDGMPLHVRATLDVDNGAAGNDVKFFTSNDGNAWVQLGATVTTAGVTSVNDTAAVVEVGSQIVGASSNLRGIVYLAEVRNGIDGPLVVSFNAGDAANGVIGFKSRLTGEEWTIARSGLRASRITTARFAA